MAKKRQAMPAPSEHNLSTFPEYVEDIGMISLETVDLELRLATLFARMLAIPVGVGQAIVLSPKAEQARIDIIRNAANARLASAPSANPTNALLRRKRDALGKVDDILNRAQGLMSKRHRIIHDDWNVSSKEKTVTRRIVDGAIAKRKRIPIGKTELENHIRSLRVLIDDIHRLSESFREHPPFMADFRQD